MGRNIEQIKVVDGEKWFLFADTVYTYWQARNKEDSWAIRCGSGIKTKIVPYDGGYLLYTR